MTARGAAWLLVATASACGEEPTFVTMQGVAVYVESGHADKDQFNCVFGAIFGARREADIVLDNEMAVFVTKKSLGKNSEGREIGAYVVDYRDVRVRDDAPDYVERLPHEVGHVAHFAIYRDPDWEHSDPTFFWAETSLEQVAEKLIRENCL